MQTTSQCNAELGEPDTVVGSNDANFEIQPDDADADPILIQPGSVDVDLTLLKPDSVDVDPTLIQPDTVDDDPTLETVAQCDDGIRDSGELDSDPITSWLIRRQDELDLLAMQPQQPTCRIPFSVDAYYLTQIDGSNIKLERLTYADKKLHSRICGCFSSNRSDDFALGIGKRKLPPSQSVKWHEV